MEYTAYMCKPVFVKGNLCMLELSKPQGLEDNSKLDFSETGRIEEYLRSRLELNPDKLVMTPLQLC